MPTWRVYVTRCEYGLIDIQARDEDEAYDIARTIDFEASPDYVAGEPCWEIDAIEHNGEADAAIAANLPSLDKEE